MADRKNAGRVRAQALRGYEERRNELVDVFNLPEGTREWVTVRYDPANPDETQTFSVNVVATAGRTTASVPLDIDQNSDLGHLLKALIEEHREELHRALKLDLATNLMAMSSVRGDGL